MRLSRWRPAPTIGAMAAPIHPTPILPHAPAHAPSPRDRQGVALMLVGGLLLGTLGAFVEEAGQDPLTTVWFRCAFGALALSLWGGVSGRIAELRLRGTALAAALSASALMIANWALFFAAIDRTSIGVATVVFHVQPLWVLVLGAWWLHERISWGQAVAALLALLGLALASGILGGNATGSTHRHDHLLGLALCLGASLSYAGVTLIAARAKGASSFALAWWQCAVGTLVLAWWPHLHGWPAFGARWAWLAGLGAIHTGLAYVALYGGMARLHTHRIALLQFVYPVSAILVDWAVYGRALGPMQLTGVAVMGAALTAVRRPS